MLSLSRFRGVNNVAPPESIEPEELTEATNFDVLPDGTLIRREGFARIASGPFSNVFDTGTYLLALRCQELVAVREGVITVLHTSFYAPKIWYCKLPNGTVLCSNGLSFVVTDGLTARSLGPRLPDSAGAYSEIPGKLASGSYRYCVTQISANGGESSPRFSDEITLTLGGLVITGVIPDEGCRLRLYLTAPSGEQYFLAAESDASGVLQFVGDTTDLNIPLRTADYAPTPPGGHICVWRGRLLTAQKNVLWASLPFSHALCDITRDYKQFEGEITGVAPTNRGVIVGTSAGAYYAVGDRFETLLLRKLSNEPVVLGSVVAVDPGALSPAISDSKSGALMIVGHDIAFVSEDGELKRFLQNRFRFSATSVRAGIVGDGPYAKYVVFSE